MTDYNVNKIAYMQ